MRLGVRNPRRMPSQKWIERKARTVSKVIAMTTTLRGKRRRRVLENLLVSKIGDLEAAGEEGRGIEAQG